MTRRDTRELILATGLALFNELGEPNVTTNQLALEADISPGNLYYHFRSREDIALDLFKRFALQMQPLLEPGDGPATDVEDLCLRLHLVFELQARYRFVFRDLAELHARIPGLRQALNGLLGRLRSSLDAVSRRLRAAGVLAIDDEGLAALTGNALARIAGWIPFAEITGGDRGEAMGHALAGVLHLYLPWLSAPERQRVARLAREYQG